MRTTLLSLGVVASVALVAPAFAEVNIYATIDKYKDIDVWEKIKIDKEVKIFAEVNVDPEKAAESMALVNQANTGNRACENCAEKTDRISSSVLNNSGITSVNQASGNMNNQGNAVSVAVDVLDPQPDPRRGGYAEAQASAEQENAWNSVNSINILFRRAIIEDSINGNNGITHVNQSPGNMNNQANLVSLALSLSPGVALAEADLGQFNSYNTVKEGNVEKTAVITNSVNTNTGIVGVNQSSGNMANQANVVAFGAAARF